MKKFNTTAICIPEKHYMVDTSNLISEIRKMVDDGKYFTINRARQYGKTTTLNLLDRNLSGEYDVLSLDFQDMTYSMYESEEKFTKGLALVICDAHDVMGAPISDDIYDNLLEFGNRKEETDLNELFRIFTKWFKENSKPVVLMIDEVDSASDSQAFLDFLGKLRADYIKKERNPAFRTFHSVILAGVTDIKHLKSKIRDEKEHKQNSPWNISADFFVDMSLSEDGIKGMLKDYENDHNTGMDTKWMAKELRAYTNGYPFLVSRLCQLMDEVVPNVIEDKTKIWTKEGFNEALKIILSEKNTLFDSLTGKLANMPELKESLRSILMNGEKIAFNVQQKNLERLLMYGFVRNKNGSVIIDNRIFETLLYNLFISDEELENNRILKEGSLSKPQFIKDGQLDMPLIMERFIKTYTEIFGPLKDKFKEKDGREQFLLYIKPIINGTGNYYIEAQTRDQTRTDLIIDYLGHQYIIELKIWRGERYNSDGEKQISEYLDYFGLETGYMLSFNFNQNKEVGVKQVEINGKTLFEGML